MKNKRINKIKLAITTECNLECDYCFVKRTRETMDLGTAKKAVDLLLRSEGKDKLLSIYGGEALLDFGLIEKLLPYARARGKKLRKDLTVSICTNATLLDKTHLVFFKRHNVKLIISLAGDKPSHDAFRKFYGGRGSYDIITKKLPAVFAGIPPENIGVSFCIFPSQVDKIPENFRHLLGLGFNYLNFEIIRDFQPWTPDKLGRFSLGLRKVVSSVLRSISRGNFIFLNPINWEIKYQSVSRGQGPNCQFDYKLEVYPGGEMAFSPFLLNSGQRDDYIIGNINDPALRRFDDCEFDPESRRCASCERDYYRGFPCDRGASRAYDFWRLACLEAAVRIRSSGNKSFAGYVREINEKVCF